MKYLKWVLGLNRQTPGYIFNYLTRMFKSEYSTGTMRIFADWKPRRVPRVGTNPRLPRRRCHATTIQEVSLRLGGSKLKRSVKVLFGKCDKIVQSNSPTTVSTVLGHLPVFKSLPPNEKLYRRLRFFVLFL